MTSANSSSPRDSSYSSVTDIKHDKEKEACEGLVNELEPLPKTKAMVGAEGFLSLAWVW